MRRVSGAAGPERGDRPAGDPRPPGSRGQDRRDDSARRPRGAGAPGGVRVTPGSCQDVGGPRARRDGGAQGSRRARMQSGDEMSRDPGRPTQVSRGQVRIVDVRIVDGARHHHCAGSWRERRSERILARMPGFFFFVEPPSSSECSLSVVMTFCRASPQWPPTVTFADAPGSPS